MMTAGSSLQRPEQTQNPLRVERRFDPFEPGLLQRLPEPPRKVAVLRASRIGDFINATPAFRALRRALPDARIDVITLPMLQDLAERCPSIDRCVPFPGYPGLADQLFEPGKTLAFFEAMQAEGYDLAIQMQGSGVYTNPFTLMLGASYNAGYVRPDDPPGRLDAALPIPDEGYEVDRALAMTTFLGAGPDGRCPELALRSSDIRAGLRLLDAAPAPWIGIHPSARDRTRRWPLERFSLVMRKLQRKFGGTAIILGEERDRDSTAGALDDAGVASLNLAGRTSLAELCGVIHQLDLLVTNDTGPAHLGYVFKTPTVVIFGGGDPERNGPLNDGPVRVLAHPVPCRPCDVPECPIGYTCLQHIRVDQVVGAAEELLTSVHMHSRPAIGSMTGRVRMNGAEVLPSSQEEVNHTKGDTMNHYSTIENLVTIPGLGKFSLEDELIRADRKLRRALRDRQERRHLHHHHR